MQHDTPCRADAHLSKAPISWAMAALVVLAALGSWAGRKYILNAADSARFPEDKRSELMVWAVLIGVLVGYALVAGIVMLQWLRKLLQLINPRVRVWTVGRWFFVILVIYGTIVLLTADFSRGGVGGQPVILHEDQILGITLFGMLAAVPGLLGFMALRSMAVTDAQWTEAPQCQIALAMRLRRELRRFLGALGMFLTLIVVTSAARRRAVLVVQPEQVFPPEFVVLYGLLFAGLLGLFHVVATMAIEGRCERLLATHSPIPSPSAPDLTTALQRRQALSTLLGAGGSWQTSFQGGVVVFAPLLTALIGAAVSGK